MKNKNIDKVISVPRTWLEQISKLGYTVRKQIRKLPQEDHNVLIKTDIAFLAGYANSAKIFLKTNEKELQQ